MAIRLVAGAGSSVTVRVLDPAARWTARAFARRLLRSMGVLIETPDFHAGSIRVAGSLATVPTASVEKANELALMGARRVMARSRSLARVDARWGRRTVSLYIAKRLWLPLYQSSTRILVAVHMARREGHAARVILHASSAVDATLLRDGFPDARIHIVRGGPVWLRSGTRVVLAAARRTAALLRGSAAKRRAPSIRPADDAIARRDMPGVLVVQHDDVGTDRSYRSQPHWLLPDMPDPEFQTYVLQTGDSPLWSNEDTAKLRAHSIALLPPRTPGQLLSRATLAAGLPRQLLRDILLCSAVALIRGGAVSAAAWRASGALAKALLLAELCVRLRVKVFVSGESYLPETDAMQIAARHVGVRTLSFQYSNLPSHSLMMMTTADQLLTFSGAYETLMQRDAVGPASITVNGYPFDSSFALVEKRAYEARHRLSQAGAEYVVCVFDETVTTDRYYNIHPDDHLAEMLCAFRAVLDDPSLGLVIKTQFRRNSPSQLYAGIPELEAVRRTGRYLELVHGTHRNTVFPAEAALIADISIGHIVGATAPLEAALAGRRSLLLNRYGKPGAHDHVYAQSNIVFASMQDALDAISRFRSGARSDANLGDWTGILDYFDPIRDGNAGRRLRLMLDEIVARGESDVPAPLFAASRNHDDVGVA